ncbi:hypothetical protein JKF63_07278 [Porcisia hertigi]|uniref:Uncharacterized protein n=1 Tax=Porcisia hertigi TaxID=2761500 RepID=A0A836YIW5_9TRYP|nr:hypothetical protein JKF63_07278 [Porcisia hertigi]
MSTQGFFGSNSQQHMWPANADHHESLLNGGLVGSLAGQSPASVVAHGSSASAAHTLTTAAVSPTLGLRANSGHSSTAVLRPGSLLSPTLRGAGNLSKHSTPRTPQSSVRGSAVPPPVPSKPVTPFHSGASDSDVVISQDRSSKHSIAVLSVMRHSGEEGWVRPSFCATPIRAGESLATPGTRETPAECRLTSSFKGVSSVAPHDPTRGQVRVDTIPPLDDTSYRSTPIIHPAMFQAVVTAEHPPPPKPPRHHITPASAANAPPPPHLATATGQPHHSSPQAPASSTAFFPPSLSTTTANSEATLDHRPSQKGVLREAGDPLSIIGPPTLQVSTTTLTTTTKKVRYLLPDEPFDPDAPDPYDIGGMTAEEEAALLNPVKYTRTVEEVVSSYPTLLRRPSAQDSDLSYGRRKTEESQRSDGAPHPTFLFDDGNRWARATNRHAVATTRDPSGMRPTTRLPAPRILQKTSVAHKAPPLCAEDEPFPARQFAEGYGGAPQLSNSRGAGAYLLQRHVQQIATGKHLVRGTVFDTPPMERRRYGQCRREQLGNDLNADAAASAQSNASRRGALPLQQPPPQPQCTITEGLYHKILRRTHQNRRTSLPDSLLPTGAPPQALPLPPEEATREARPTIEHRGRQSNPPSAEPTPLHHGPSVSFRTASRQLQVPQLPRAASQPYTPSTFYYNATKSRKAGSVEVHRIPPTYARVQHSQPAMTSLNGMGATPAGDAGPSPPTYTHPPHSSSAQQHQQRHQNVLTPSQPSSMAHSSLLLSGVRNSAMLDPQPNSAQPRRQGQHSPMLHGSSNYGAMATAPRNGGPVSGYTSARFSKYNGNVSASPLPPPHTPPPPTDEVVHTPNSSSSGGSGGGGGGGKAHHFTAAFSHSPSPPSAGSMPPYSHVRRMSYPSPPRAQPYQYATAYASQPPPQQQHQHKPWQHHPYSPFSPRGAYATAENDRQDVMHGDYARAEKAVDSPFPYNTATGASPMSTPHRHSNSYHNEAVPASCATMPALEANSVMTQVCPSLLARNSRVTYVRDTPQTGRDSGWSRGRRGEPRHNIDKTPTHRTAVAPTKSLRTEALGRPHNEARPHNRPQGSATPPPHRPRSTAAATSSAVQRTAIDFTGHSRGGIGNVGNAAAANPAPAQDFGEGSSVASQAEFYEAPASASSCYTGTQPVAVSERSEDDAVDSDDDNLVKKGPPVLIFSDDDLGSEEYDEYMEERDDYEEDHVESEYRGGGAD